MSRWAMGDLAAEHGAPPLLSTILKTAPDAAVAALGIKAAPRIAESPLLRPKPKLSPRLWKSKPIPKLPHPLNCKNRNLRMRPSPGLPLKFL